MDTSEKPSKAWIGFDLGGTKMLAAAFDDSRRVLCRKKKKIRGTDGAKDGFERIWQTIEETLEEVGEPELRGIGIGCPGPVDMDRGVVLIAPNLGWRDFEIGDLLGKRFGCPVAVLNDVDAGVYGEHVAGAAVGSRCTVGIFPGTGVGGGCVYDGQIIRGSRLSAMEIGHMRISNSDRRGGSAMLGTLESEASRLSIASECARLAYRGDAPNLLKAVGTDVADIRSKAIFEAIKKGDVEVERVLQRAIDQLGYAAVNLVHLLAPDTIVLGGGMVEANPEVYLRGVRRAIDSYTLDCYRGSCKVVAAKLGDDATALGAAAWLQRQVLAHPLGQPSNKPTDQSQPKLQITTPSPVAGDAPQPTLQPAAKKDAKPDSKTSGKPDAKSDVKQDGKSADGEAGKP